MIAGGTIFSDTDIEIVKIVMQKKDLSGSSTFYISDVYLAADEVYSGSPVCYPLLAGSPRVIRGMGTYTANRYDVTIPIYARGPYDTKGVSFQDYLATHEFHNAAVSVFYYPKARAGTTTHAATTNTRQVLTVINQSFDSGSGILSLGCRDTWPKDREVSRVLDDTVLTDLDDRSAQEYGGIVFGKSTTAADGIMLDAPIFDSNTDSNVPNMKVFAGHVFNGHPNNLFKRLMVRNQTPELSTSDWLQAYLPANPQTAVVGDATITPTADPTEYGRDLSRYELGRIWAPDTSGNILSAVQCQIKVQPYERCIDLTSSSMYYTLNRPDALSAGDISFSVEVWVYVDSFGGGSAFGFHQGAVAVGAEEWSIENYNSAGNNFVKFRVSDSAGSGSGAEAVTAASWSTNTWYQIVARYDKAGATAYVQVNNGTAATAAISSAPVKDDLNAQNYFYFGGWDGKVGSIRYWRDRVLAAGDITSLYNSGSGVPYRDLTAGLKEDLYLDFECNEPAEPRRSSIGQLELVPLYSSAASYAYGYRPVTIDNSHGELAVSVYQAESQASGNSYKPIREYRRAVVDVTTSGFTSGTNNCFFQIDPPFVGVVGKEYLISLDWTNDDTNSHIITGAYKTTGGQTTYSRDKRNDKRDFEKKASTELAMALYCVGDGDDAFEDSAGSGNNRYSYYHLEGKTITLSTGQTHLLLNNSLDFKIGVWGLEDDGSGTYTGSANALIEKPSDILHFLLRNSDFGSGASSGLIDTTAFSDIRTDIAALIMKIVIDRQMTAYDLIQELCRQGRFNFYKRKDGLFSVRYPTGLSSFDATITEGDYQGDALLLSVADNDYSQVVNDFKQVYGPDILNVQKDPATIRKAGTDKYTGVVVCNKTEETGGLTGRVDKCSESDSLYERREHRAPLDYYDALTAAQTVQQYYVDRYVELNKKATVQFPRKFFYNTLDLFSKIRLHHTGIQSATGTSDFCRAHDTGTPAILYFEGVPMPAYSAGVLEGEVVQIEESGPYMNITIETIPQGLE